MALIKSTAIPSGATDYELEQSLKFNDDDNTQLERTFTSTGDRKKWTWSAWIKRGNIATNMALFSAKGNTGMIWLAGVDGVMRVEHYNGAGGYDFRRDFDGYHRDASAWYHFIIVYDSAQGSEVDRIKFYRNGEAVGVDNTADAMTQNFQSAFNSNETHWLGAINHSFDYDGYMAEVNFVDGQTLTPADFGETGTYGEWKPIEYSGTYGTNGFYLPFKQDYTVEGFSTVTYRGTGTTNYIGGTGFQPDLLWIKKRDGTTSHELHDSVRGITSMLTPNSTAADSDGTDASSTEDLMSFDTDGFTVGTAYHGRTNTSGGSYVAWNWDMGGSNATNTNGSITSTVRANTTYGQSIVSYTGTGYNGVRTVGHGLSSAPNMVIYKNRSTTDNWIVWHSEAFSGNGVMYLENTTGGPNTSAYNNLVSAHPTSSVFSVNTQSSGTHTNGNGNDIIAYCFHSVTGYSKFGSYTGNGSATGTVVTTGFAPAFVMIKRTDASKSWFMADNTRNPNNAVGKYSFANLSDAEYDYTRLNFTSTGFQLASTDNTINNSGSNYIYMAFADKREYAYWLDQSGNNNDWTSNNLTESEISVDSPTNNFATLNPLDSNSNITLAEGNLKYIATGGWYNLRGSMFVSSGKWYWEMVKTTSTSIYTQIGAATSEPTLTEDYGDAQNGMWVYSAHNGTKVGQGTSPTSYGASYVTGDVMGIALDMDNGTITFYKNNVSQGQAFSGITGDVAPWISGFNNNNVYNFGQDSSFAGTKTAQGNQDGNNIGDFYYTPPTGFLALCTKNLPDVDVVPSEHFDVALYTGDSSVQSITSLGFQPSFTWIKERSDTAPNQLFDAVRGVTKNIASNANSAETTNDDTLTHFLSNGFTTGDDNRTNSNGETYVSWNWKANGSGSSNTDGSINTISTSANVDAGFSISTYTSNGTAGATVGHGLSKAPELVIIKNRDAAYEWAVAESHTGSGFTSNNVLFLDLTNAYSSSGNCWNSTAPTSTLVTLGDNGKVNISSAHKFVMYCFHSVDGYSKVGSYTGNDSSNGTFVYTSFAPSLVILKYASGSAGGTKNWHMYDNKRSTYNPTENVLFANESTAESGASAFDVDFLSNGFKLRNAEGAVNNAAEYIFIAFSETPFKYSNAR